MSVQYTDPKRFKIAQQDWESLSEKQRACPHDWDFHYRDVVKYHTVWKCSKCGVQFNQKRGGGLPGRHSEEPTFRKQEG